MTELTRKALSGYLKFHLFLGVLLFLPAWTLHFWQAWVYWILFSCSTLAISIYFLKVDPLLIARRLEVGAKAETRKRQKIVQRLASPLYCVLFVTPGFEHRFHGAQWPPAVVLFADVLVALSFWIIFRVFFENRHTAATIRVEEGQPVISTGPYRFVRHPMYAGSVVLFVATPFALASPWALVPAMAICSVIVVRLLDEEQLLLENLPGYQAYRAQVRYRLVPWVW